MRSSTARRRRRPAVCMPTRDSCLLATCRSRSRCRASRPRTRAMQVMVRLGRLDPTVRQQLLGMLGAMNKPELALPMVNEMLQDNPGDPQLLRMRFLLYASAKDYKKALAAGEEWMKTDTAAANADLYTRLIAIASADSQPQVASQYAARAVQED